MKSYFNKMKAFTHAFKHIYKKEALVIRKESKDSETDQTDQRIIRCYPKWGQPAHIQMETWTPKLAAAWYGTKKWAITVERSFNTCPFTLHFTVHTPGLKSKPNFSPMMIRCTWSRLASLLSSTQLQTQNQQHYKGTLPDQNKTEYDLNTAWLRSRVWPQTINQVDLWRLLF